MSQSFLRSSLAFSALLTGLVLPQLAFASDWDVDVAHSRVGFGIRHMMVSNTRGSFSKFTGTVALDDKDISKSVVHVDIEAASINTDNAKRDEHLRSADFFDAAKFPKITFHSTKVEKQGDKLLVTGNLSIRNVTKSVILSVVPTAEIKDPFGMIRRGAQASTKINRKDFGLTYNKVLEAGGVALGEEVTIELDVELTKKVEAEAAKKKPATP